MYDAAARGPCRQRLRAELTTEFSGVWDRDGRPCQAQSLTGAPCELPMHSEDHRHAAPPLMLATLDATRLLRLPAPFSGREFRELAHRLRRDCTLHSQCTWQVRLEDLGQAEATAGKPGGRSPAKLPADTNGPLHVHLYALPSDETAALQLPCLTVTVETPGPGPRDDFPALSQAPAAAAPASKPFVVEWPGWKDCKARFLKSKVNPPKVGGCACRHRVRGRSGSGCRGRPCCRATLL